MSRPVRPGDLIEQYLDELRRGLRAVPGEAEAILAEAEDHLRETAAAGVAIGMTEREAQEAAISSFGQVRAVTRAHLARLTRGTAVLASAAMAAWKLVSLLLLAVGVSGMAAIVLTGLDRPVRAAGLAFMAGPGPSRIASDHLSFNLVSGAWTETVTWTGPHPANQSRGVFTWLAQPILGWHTVVLLAVGGGVMLAGYGLARRRSPHETLARFFPAVAVSVFGAVALALLVLELSTQAGIYDPRPAIAAFLALALGYAVRLGRLLLCQR
jgi:hypothetical protein